MLKIKRSPEGWVGLSATKGRCGRDGASELGRGEGSVETACWLGSCPCGGRSSFNSMKVSLPAAGAKFPFGIW